MSASGTNQGLRAGVCLSTTRPASPFAGQVIFETDTNRLAVYNGSSWVVLADADTPPALELIKTQTIGTAVSSVEVANVFSATYDNYRIIVGGGSASGNTDLRVTLGSTTTNYNYGLTYTNYATATASSTRAQATSSFVYAGQGTSETLSMNIDLLNPFLSKRTLISGVLVQSNTDGSSGVFGGVLSNTDSYTGFTITSSAGTITGGTIRVYGYRNS